MRLGELFAHRRKYTTALRILVPIVLFFVVNTPFLSAQEKPYTIILAGEGARELPLRVMHSNSTAHLSLNDISRALSFKVSEHRRNKSLEIKANGTSLLFTAGNPFVAIVTQARDTSGLQLPSAVEFSNGNYFILLKSCIQHFEKLFGVAAAFDADANALRLNKPPAVKPAFDITGVVFEQKSNGTLIRIQSKKRITDFESILKQDGWLYVTLPNAKAEIAKLDRAKPQFGVKKIIATQFRTTAQLAFRLEGRFLSSDAVKDELSDDILVLLRVAVAEARPKPEEKKPSPAQAELDEQRKKYELDVIVLDAGHGGKDPGTIGVSGTKEKDIALGIVLKLGRLIEKNLKGVKVVYTRKTDTFVELDRRGQIANEANGKLFISVHCNSMPKKPHPKRGFEVFLLRPGRTDDAIAIAERENSVIELEEGYEQRYQKLTDENFILVTMAQTAHMKASEMFAEFTSKELDRRLSKPNNGVTQAGFLVLVGASMPNVLIETAYLSNKEDERFLKSDGGQQDIAEAIFNGIKRYKAEYEKLLKEGNDLGSIPSNEN